jgi:hypothetical protein
MTFTGHIGRSVAKLEKFENYCTRPVSRLSKDLTARLRPAGLKVRVCEVSGLGWGLNRGHCDRFCCSKGHETDSLPRPLSRFYGAIKLFKSNVSFCSQTAWFIHILVNTAQAYQSRHAISR